MAIIFLEAEPQLSGQFYKKSYRYAEEDESSVLFKHPCLSLLTPEVNQFVDRLPNDVRAKPMKYFVSESNEVDTVRLFVRKCPDGTIQNIKQARCEEAPGKSLKAICTAPDPMLGGRNRLDMLTIHINKLAREQQQP